MNFTCLPNRGTIQIKVHLFQAVVEFEAFLVFVYIWRRTNLSCKAECFSATFQWSAIASNIFVAFKLSTSLAQQFLNHIIWWVASWWICNIIIYPMLSSRYKKCGVCWWSPQFYSLSWSCSRCRKSVDACVKERHFWTLDPKQISIRVGSFKLETRCNRSPTALVKETRAVVHCSSSNVLD